MNKTVRILLIILLIVLLMFLRGVFSDFMYDPLISYFKKNYLHTDFPIINVSKYFLFLSIRYSINSLISLVIIYLFYLKKNYLVLAVKLYLGGFIFFSLILFLSLKYTFFEGYMVVFYVRRFLIHPLLMLIIIPAFYYQILQTKNKQL